MTRFLINVILFCVAIWVALHTLILIAAVFLGASR